MCYNKKINVTCFKIPQHISLGFVVDGLQKLQMKGRVRDVLAFVGMGIGSYAIVRVALPNSHSSHAPSGLEKTRK